MGIPGHFTCLLKSLYAGQEAIVRIELGKTDWFQIEKGIHQGSILSPCLFFFYADYIMWNAGWVKLKLESSLLEVISIPSYMQMTPHLWQKVKGTTVLLDDIERGVWKSWLKTQHSKNKDYGIWPHQFMANRWGNNGNSERLYSFGLQNRCRYWLQPWN